MRNIKHIIIAILLTVITVQPTFAATEDGLSEPLNITRWYKVYWLGMHVGDLVTQLKEDDGAFHMESHIKARGVAKKVSKYWSVTQSIIGFDGKDFVPEHFYSESRLRKKRRNIELQYAAGGKITGESVNPPENTEKRPPVKDSLKLSSVDPHTAALIARKEILAGLKNGTKEFSIPLYEGRRRSDLIFTLHGKEIMEFNKQDIPVVHISLRRDAVAGYTDRELERMQTEEPRIHIYLEDNELLLPVKAHAKAPIGEAFAVFEQECYAVHLCEETPKGYAVSKFIDTAALGF